MNSAGFVDHRRTGVSIPVWRPEFPVFQIIFPVSSNRELLENSFGARFPRSKWSPEYLIVPIFPVKFPVSREIQVETGAISTASPATPSQPLEDTAKPAWVGRWFCSIRMRPFRHR
jgi:hypothetical protein